MREKSEILSGPAEGGPVEGGSRGVGGLGLPPLPPPGVASFFFSLGRGYPSPPPHLSASPKPELVGGILGLLAAGTRAPAGE